MIEEIIKKFKYFIKEKRWTQEYAAGKIGCCQEHLSRVLNGKKTPSVALLMRMERIMKDGAVEQNFNKKSR